jgi:hypothetical protein
MTATAQASPTSSEVDLGSRVRISEQGREDVPSSENASLRGRNRAYSEPKNYEVRKSEQKKGSNGSSPSNRRRGMNDADASGAAVRELWADEDDDIKKAADHPSPSPPLDDGTARKPKPRAATCAVRPTPDDSWDFLSGPPRQSLTTSNSSLNNNASNSTGIAAAASTVPTTSDVVNPFFDFFAAVPAPAPAVPPPSSLSLPPGQGGAVGVSASLAARRNHCKPTGKASEEILPAKSAPITLTHVMLSSRPVPKEGFELTEDLGMVNSVVTLKSSLVQLSEDQTSALTENARRAAIAKLEENARKLGANTILSVT